jgi:uncharacterized protein (TIGR04376 family)
MGLFEDVSQFLERRIDEFLKNNPHLELQALDDKLREQLQESDRLLKDLKAREMLNEGKILEIAQEVKRWDERIGRAKAANRLDLMEPAQNHLAGLMREGNQLWGQMELIKERVKQTQDLAEKIKVQRRELQQRILLAQQAQKSAAAQANAQRTAAAPRMSWADEVLAGEKRNDPLEKKFASWEAEEEIARMKREMGR